MLDVHPQITVQVAAAVQRGVQMLPTGSLAVFSMLLVFVQCLQTAIHCSRDGTTGGTKRSHLHGQLHAQQSRQAVAGTQAVLLDAARVPAVTGSHGQSLVVQVAWVGSSIKGKRVRQQQAM